MADRYERVGFVTAAELTVQRTWTTDQGDELTSQPGDFWVVDAAGAGRGVARDRFADLYEPTGVPGRYRRRGTVTARRVRSRETVPTLEGPAVAEPGMWVLTDDHGDSWPVTDAYLRQHYRREAPALDRTRPDPSGQAVEPPDA